MKNNKFKKGTIIKGRDLKDHILCKVLLENMTMYGFQYEMGMNTDINMPARNGSYEAGLCFNLINDICYYIGYGDCLAIVHIPDNEDVSVEIGEFCTHRLEIERIMRLNEVSTWEYLVEHGADITMRENCAIRWTAEDGYLEVVKYLHKSGADIQACDNYALVFASQYGHFDVVKYLCENGADIIARENDAVRKAAENGYLEIVKYLYEHGADITIRKNYALMMASENGHLEVVKYLYEHGADLQTCDNYAITAAENGHLKVVKYLYENGADIRVRNDYALRHAIDNEYSEVAEYIEANI